MLWHGCRVEYLSKFSPSPSSPGASFAGALVERMAGRILVFFVRHASLLRPLSQAGKVQLAKVGSPSCPQDLLQYDTQYCRRSFNSIAGPRTSSVAICTVEVEPQSAVVLACHMAFAHRTGIRSRRSQLNRRVRGTD